MVKPIFNIHWAVVAGLLVVAGCGGGDKSTKLLQKLNDSNIKRVSMLYTVFQGQHGMKGPKDENELKDFISSRGSKALARIGVSSDNIQSLFVSERDDEPFKIRYGLKTNSRQPPVPIVFESVGVEDKFMVAFSGFVCKEVDKATYDQLWEGEEHKANTAARGVR